MEKRNVLIDLHNHAIHSQFADADKDMSIDYDRIFGMLQQKAEDSNTDFIVAVTEHDNFSMTKEEFNKYRREYPNVKIILGMEVNTYLTKVTDGLFKKAHMLVYADMSSEDGINKWFDNDKLKDLTLIKTWEDQSLSKKLFIAKNVLNKVLDINVTNKELATILVENGEYNFYPARKAFMNLVCDKLQENHPEEYEILNNVRTKGRDISSINFFTHTFKKTGVTARNFDDLIPQIREMDFAPDIKVPIEEIDQIAKETGGHIVLAHPQVAFKTHEGVTIEKDKILHNGDMSTVSLNNVSLENKILLLRDLCAEKGIKIEGIELTRKAIKDPKKLVEILDFAKNNKLEISFGSDVHYTTENYNNELTNSTKTYKKIHFDFKDFAESQNQNKNTKKNKKGKKGKKGRNNGRNKSEEVEEIQEKSAGRKLNHEVKHVSMYDKIMGKKSNTLFEMTINDRQFKYEKTAKYDAELTDIMENGLEK